MLEHLHPLARVSELRRDDREGMTWLNRPVEAEVTANLVFDLQCLAVLECDPVQPVAVGLVNITRNQNRPSLLKMFLTPRPPGVARVARRVLPARAERSWLIGDHNVAGDLCPRLDL